MGDTQSITHRGSFEFYHYFYKPPTQNLWPSPLLLSWPSNRKVYKGFWILCHRGRRKDSRKVTPNWTWVHHFPTPTPTIPSKQTEFQSTIPHGHKILSVLFYRSINYDTLSDIKFSCEVYTINFEILGKLNPPPVYEREDLYSLHSRLILLHRTDSCTMTFHREVWFLWSGKKMWFYRTVIYIKL